MYSRARLGPIAWWWVGSSRPFGEAPEACSGSKGLLRPMPDAAARRLLGMDMVAGAPKREGLSILQWHETERSLQYSCSKSRPRKTLLRHHQAAGSCLVTIQSTRETKMRSRVMSHRPNETPELPFPRLEPMQTVEDRTRG